MRAAYQSAGHNIFFTERSQMTQVTNNRKKIQTDVVEEHCGKQAKRSGILVLGSESG